MQEQNEEAFVIDNDSKAEWAMRKVREARANTAMWTEHYNQALQRIKADNEATEAHMLALLHDYFLTVPHRQTKTMRSYALPGGTMVEKQQKPEYVLNDAVLVQWCRENAPECIKVRESADWAQLKKMCVDGTATIADTGENLPGVTVVQREPKFEITGG